MQGSVAKTPYFPETISCPVLFLGESGDSGQSRLRREGKKTGNLAISERFTGRDRGVVPDQGSGLKTGDSYALASGKLGFWWLDDGFRCFRYYLPSKFHALSSLCLVGLGTYVAGGHRNTVRER